MQHSTESLFLFSSLPKTPLTAVLFKVLCYVTGKKVIFLLLSETHRSMANHTAKRYFPLFENWATEDSKSNLSDMTQIVCVTSANVYLAFILICAYRCKLRALLDWQWRPSVL